REHHSFVELPDSEYHPRVFDPHIGFFPVTVWDFARGFEHDYRVRFIMRHRLIKKDPSAAMSEAVQPIVYYLDPGIPEPYRTALEQGAGWWNKVLEAAGFIDAFQVKVLPPDVDPMDARYNVIMWVERTSPGYSIGPSFVDPRTGEIIKAAVRMDTYRSQSDFDIYAGTVPATGMDEAAAEDGSWLASLDPNTTPEAFAMARRRQHAAHEVGHTLGLAHNFAATTYGRASVMDYPAPYITLNDGTLDLSHAYRNGPGAWDSLAIRYGYTEYADSAAEAKGLAAIVHEAMARGMTFITNPDQANDGSYPAASEWVNGSDMNDELARMMNVRRFLIGHFDQRAIQPGQPMALLVKRFTPVYLWDRFTLLAAIKAVGGMAFRYAVRGDTIPPTRVLSPERQRRALKLVMSALTPSELAVPERVIQLMAPRPFGFPPDERALHSDAGPAFDQLAVARTFATEIVSDLLSPPRLARVVAFNARDPNEPGLDEVLSDLTEQTWSKPATGPNAALDRVVQRVVVDQLLALAGNDDATVDVRAGAEWALRSIMETANQRAPLTAADAAHLHMVEADIQRYLSRTDEPTKRSKPVAEPPSDPIGGR
ncbi:MAG TPA: zinc-dependent metalloprotease, partial [Gemmatimonadales bacterium]|nr:zinc-dependent metalloprotease [Gemmatimonadales bacterium]